MSRLGSEQLKRAHINRNIKTTWKWIAVFNKKSEQLTIRTGEPDTFLEGGAKPIAG